MSDLKEKISVGIAGNMYSSAGHEMLMDIDGTPLAASDDNEFRPEVQYNDYCIKMSHKEDYVLYTYIANPTTVHSYGASRPGALWIALTVPARKSLSGTDPYALLMEILTVFRREYMQLRADGSYEFKEINCASAPVRSILDKYQLREYNRFVPMRGDKLGFVKANSKENMRDFLRDTQYDEFKEYSTIIVAENVNGNYLDITIPRRHNYEVLVNGERQQDKIGIQNPNFSKIFQQDDYHYPVTVEFCLDELRGNNGVKTVHTGHYEYEVKMDDYNERIDVEIVFRKIVFNHDVTLDSRLDKADIQVTLDGREYEMEKEQDGFSVKLAGEDEKKAADLKFSHEKYELKSALDANGSYSVRIESTKFKGTKCLISGTKRDMVTIHCSYGRDYYEYKGKTEEILFSGVHPEYIRSLESSSSDIEYRRNDNDFGNKDGWDRIGFDQVVYVPSYINNLPQDENKGKCDSNDAGSTIIIRKDSELDELNTVYVECIYSAKTDELPEMFRIKKCFNDQDNITFRIPDIYAGKDIYKIIIYTEKHHSAEFILEESHEESHEISLYKDSFSGRRDRKPVWPFSNRFCRKFNKMEFWLPVVLLIACVVGGILYYVSGDKDIKKFTEEYILPIDDEIKNAEDLFKKDNSSVIQLDSVVKLCKALIDEAEEAMCKPDQSLSEKQINRLKKKLYDKKQTVLQREGEIKGLLEEKFKRYYTLMTNLKYEEGSVKEEMTFSMPCDIQKLVDSIDSSSVLKGLIQNDTNYVFVSNYIKHVVEFVDEINRLKDCGGYLRKDVKDSSSGINCGKGIRYSKVAGYGYNQKWHIYKTETEFEQINEHLCGGKKNTEDGKKLQKIRSAIQVLYFTGSSDYGKQHEDIIEKTILTKDGKESGENTLLYRSTDGDITIDSFQKLLDIRDNLKLY